jgi:hypothetical protein
MQFKINRFFMMPNRFLNKDGHNSSNQADNNDAKMGLDDLKESLDVLDLDAMKKVEGGTSSNLHFSDQYGWNSTPGSNVPS